MRVGSIVFATEQGLGYLAKDFFDNGVVNDVFVVGHHKRRNLHTEWYPGAGVTNSVRSNPRLKEFCEACDVMLFFETPFDWGLIDHCRAKGVKTVVMPMHECMPETWPARPDAILNPSLLDQKCFPEGVFIPVPVPKWVKWVGRTEARTFVHNAGHGGLRGRNGTEEVLRAWRHVRSDAKLILRYQDPQTVRRFAVEVSDPRVELRCGTFPQEELWATGDVFLFPEKFNGLSLPMQEAFASGMVVSGTARYPMTTWLPADPLTPPLDFSVQKIGGPYRLYQEAVIDPRKVAETVDRLYSASPERVGEWSRLGREFGEANSWEKLKPRYVEFLDAVQKGTV